MYAWHGSADSRSLVVLAPGDEGRLSDSAPTCIAEGLAAHGLQVLRADFPPCAVEDGEVRDGLVANLVRAMASERQANQRLVLAGMSRGARVSGDLCDELGAAALLAFAYPFHARRDPNPGDRVARLSALTVPVWIGQGTRDSHGNREQVRGYGLGSHIHVHWLEDANHALHPRARSGHTQVVQLSEATTAAVAFLRERV